MPKIFAHNIQVGSDAIDENNHVNNVVYVQWMQDVAILHSTAQGWSMDEYFTFKTGWVARSHYIQYRSPAFLNDTVIAYTWISTMDRLSCLRKCKFVRKIDSTVIAETETEWVFIDIATGRPTKILESVRNSFQVVPVHEEP